MQDWHDLHAYAHGGSQEAFTAIVRRYAGPVFAMCLRQLGDRQLAEDATQAVFLALAQRAARLGPGTVLSGWLFQASRYVCANVRRAEQRRRRHEQAARANAPSSSTSASESQDLAPMLDDAVASLRVRDRQLVVLRYMRGLSVAELAAEIGVSEPAARKRLSRALERLREYFERHGATVAGAEVVLASPDAPVALVESIVQVCTATPALVGAGSVVPTSVALAKGILTAMAAQTTKMLGAGAITALVVIGGATIAIFAASARRAPPTPVLARAPLPQPVTLAEPRQPTGIADVDEATRLADARDYAAAIDRYGAWLASLSVEEYRDKKDFDWLLRTYEKQRAGQPKVDYQELMTVAQQSIDNHPAEAAIFAWRAHRLLADIAEKRNDKAGVVQHLDKAIEAYPRVDYPDPARLSSMQHLYNRRATLIADEQGIDAAEKYVLDKFETDDRFTYFFAIEWQKVYARRKEPKRFESLADRVIEIYQRKADRDPASAGRFKEFVEELKATLQQARPPQGR
jgi:RNA polymerase sigma factor (sigma-70 family)